ncbi:hypothetical protein ACFSCX_17580 [Bacillus salitolerans]|uniref:DUF4367 domain-containing protein n=1 Tax=Bacillus salitolerans TaxID=1437434 RepID=A0ABW4LT80_9BACI
MKRLKSSFICMVIIVMTACSLQGNSYDDTSQIPKSLLVQKLKIQNENKEFTTYEPVNLETAKEVLPFLYRTPNKLPFKYVDPKVTIDVLKNIQDQEKIKVSTTFSSKDGIGESLVYEVTNYNFTLDLIIKNQTYDKKLKINGQEAYFSQYNESSGRLQWRDEDTEISLEYNNLSKGNVQKELVKVAKYLTN